jgi:hypothetical protein
MPLHLHVTEKDKDAILKSFRLTEELVFRAKQYTKNLDVELKEYLEETPIFKKKFPKGRALTKFEKFKPNKASQKDDSDSGGWSTDSSGSYIEKKITKKVKDIFGKDIEVEESLPTIKNKLVRNFEIEEFETDTEPEETTDNENEETIDGVNLKKLRSWYRGKNTLVGKMIRFLYAQDKEITFEEFKEGVGYTGSNEQFLSNVSNARGVATRNGKLWLFINNKIILNNKIKQILNTY